MIASNVSAQSLEEVCDLIVKKLDSGPYIELSREEKVFESDGEPFKGCVITFTGNSRQSTEQQSVDKLIGNQLPVCRDGKPPEELSAKHLNKDGWCMDMSADGKDGTSYRALKEGLLCHIYGSWDGGDDSDPTYIRSDKYAITVKCAGR